MQLIQSRGASCFARFQNSFAAQRSILCAIRDKSCKRASSKKIGAPRFFGHASGCQVYVLIQFLLEADSSLHHGSKAGACFMRANLTGTKCNEHKKAAKL